MSFVACVSYRVRRGAEAELERVFAQLAEPTRREPGCVSYQFFRDCEDPQHYFLFEYYTDETAYRQHQRSVYFERWAKGVIPSLVEERAISRYQPVELAKGNGNDA